jgi:hypothetical protein
LIQKGTSHNNGLSKPADPPSPTVRELVIIWAYICFFGTILAFLQPNIKFGKFLMEPPRTLLTTNTVNTRPAIGKRLLMKLSFRIPLMYVAKEKT